MSKKTHGKRHIVTKTRKKPVRLPISFESAVEGLLAVKPAQKKRKASKKLAGRTKKKA